MTAAAAIFGKGWRNSSSLISYKNKCWSTMKKKKKKRVNYIPDLSTKYIELCKTGNNILPRNSHQATIKTRCSPKAIAKIMEELGEKDELMKAIEDMGFGSLKHLHGVKLEHQYIRELVNSFHVQSSSVCGVVVTDKDVGDILGVKSSGKLIPNISNDHLAKFQDKYKKKNITTLTTALKEFEHADLNFREHFFLCTFSNFYCPIVKDIPCRRLYDALPVLTSPQEYSWGKFILDFLVEEIGNYKLRAQGKDASSLRNLGVGGCTYFLQVFYLQRISPLPVERGKPVMSAWTTEETRKVKKMTEKAKKKTEKAKGPKNIINNDDGNKEQFVKDFPGCSSLEQRMARVEQLLEGFPGCTILGQRMAELERLLRGGSRMLHIYVV